MNSADVRRLFRWLKGLKGCLLLFYLYLDVGRVEHDTDGGTERLGGEVVSELSTNDTGVACK